MSTDNSPKLPRREALKWMATAAAAPAVALATGPTATAQPAVPSAVATPARTLTDPDLTHTDYPWPRLLTEDELRTVTALCDVMLPADDRSPAASKVGVPGFINEWISAPYAIQSGVPNAFRAGPKLDLPDLYPTVSDERALLRGGLVWLNAESQRRFEKDFADLTLAQQTAICDDICHLAEAKPEFRTGAVFFARFRDLTASGFYTSVPGMEDLKYIGNVALTSFNGPPPEVLKHLGLSN